MFWTRAILWKIIKVLGYLIGMVRYYPARKKKYFFVPYLTRPHILRHTGCTRLGENNVNPKVMQYVMGHSDAQITMNIYNHIAEMSHVENEMSKMNLPETVPAVV